MPGDHARLVRTFADAGMAAVIAAHALANKPLPEYVLWTLVFFFAVNAAIKRIH